MNKKDQILRYGILALESLEHKLTFQEAMEMEEIAKDLGLTHKEILDEFAIVIVE